LPKDKQGGDNLFYESWDRNDLLNYSKLDTLTPPPFKHQHLNANSISINAKDVFPPAWTLKAFCFITLSRVANPGQFFLEAVQAPIIIGL
jgi:hypothetical protein